MLISVVSHGGGVARTLTVGTAVNGSSSHRGGVENLLSPRSTAFTLDTERVPGESQVGRYDINHITRRVLFDVQNLTVRTKLPKRMKVWAGSLFLL